MAEATARHLRASDPPLLRPRGQKSPRQTLGPPARAETPQTQVRPVPRGGKGQLPGKEATAAGEDLAYLLFLVIKRVACCCCCCCCLFTPHSTVRS